MQQAAWPAPAPAPSNKEIILDRYWFTFLSGAIRCRPHHHFLRLPESEPGVEPNVDYIIAFDPAAQQIREAGTSEVWDLHAGTTGLRAQMRCAKERRVGYEAAKSLGLRIPHQEDAETLLSELQRGVDLA